MRNIYTWNYQSVDQFKPTVKTLAIRIGTYEVCDEFSIPLISPLILEKRIVAGELDQ